MDLSIPLSLALLTTGLPLAAGAFILLFLRRCAGWSAGIALTAAGLSLAGSVVLLVLLPGMSPPLQLTGRWLVSGQVTILFGFLLDPLSLLMLVVVASISFLVQLYSLGYMAGDPGFARYYGFLSLFAWAMLNLTLAATLLQLFIFWELVGLSSYLLIGFWFEKYSATQAGKKAFVMTRLGDVFFYAGIVLLLIHIGQLDIRQLNSLDAVGQYSPAVLTAATLLMLGGIIGKSAQFPLLTWLPDAMEGPTPVSALLHSATMVAAGVYLLARLQGLFSMSPAAMTVCLVVGCVSMLAAATMAMVNDDIKQVWAYSTISQLGLMVMAMGAGGFTAGVFHLTTHAAFKALLFLCAGVFIHRFGTNDMFSIGRLGGGALKLPMGCMVVGAASLAGIPPFAGFFSKELILTRLAGLSNPVWLLAGLLGVFLTAYYTFRLILIIARPQTRSRPPADTGHQAVADHSSAGRISMAVVLIVLALATLILGWFQNVLEGFLEEAFHSSAVHPGWLPILALILALAGLALAWMEFGRRGALQKGFVQRWPGLTDFFHRRWYLDHIYDLLVKWIVDRGLALLCARGDQKVIDGGLDAMSRGTIATGRFLARRHVGPLQSRLMVLFVTVVLMVVYVLVR